ncbi:dihydrolipoamide acetyltransferase component (E2) of acetoin dehydrogenase complex [Sporolactobacillus inulinus]|uniref:Dihydrolipoamide acetyltransferase component (E2) of acetoin dehydrogenase complex n=1 Tax=Sporolactobacillus inulinus TaxID=2078 RepID=A0A4Y1ZEB7_9BACL|nr:dihydrolipoamide acetyltransferase component (E2) of acetoin dehydrogenase complex [Sporolactobacillus inulinus]
MAVEIIMPKMGMGMEEGTVVEWLKQKGDSVKKGEPVVSISSDKIEKDLEAPEDGVLIDIEAEADDVVPIGHPVGYIGAPGESVQTDQANAAQPAKEEKDAPATATPAPSPQVPDGDEEPRLRVSPAARRLANQRGLIWQPFKAPVRWGESQKRMLQRLRLRQNKNLLYKRRLHRQVLRHHRQHNPQGQPKK